MKKIIVLAGNYGEFQRLIWDYPEPEKYIYGENPEKLFRIEAERVMIIGTFWERKDAGKLKEIADSRVR